MRLRRLLALLLVVASFLSACGEAPGDDRAGCTSDALRGPDGKLYGRDPSKGCKFVDDDGNVLPDQ